MYSGFGEIALSAVVALQFRAYLDTVVSFGFVARSLFGIRLDTNNCRLKWINSMVNL